MREEPGPKNATLGFHIAAKKGYYIVTLIWLGSPVAMSEISSAGKRSISTLTIPIKLGLTETCQFSFKQLAFEHL